MKKKIAYFLVLLLASCGLYAQQDAQYTQYMYNTISINPAYAGSRGILSIAALHRSQWTGIDGAPVTQTINLHAPMGRLRNMGYGLSIVNDKIGIVSETHFDIDFSYTIETSYNSKLSFGIKGGGHLLDIRFSELNQDPNGGQDLLLAADIKNKFSPNVGVGMYFHMDNFYAGLSIPNLLETEHYDRSFKNSNEINNGGKASYLASERMNYYFISGYVFDINDNLQFKPAVLGKMVAGAPIQVDASATFLYNKKMSMGVAYRFGSAYSVLAGFQVSDALMVGLAHDREISELGNTKYSGGSYEIFVRLEFIRYLDRILTPRFF
ncbi:MAG: type IX secretion system membrane protein PorP/SprF [Flavobacteriaceae bacterium]|nr:type IX secretion system membrane protein PorP/SprF [Flavobacteriaceae bacterium]